MEKKERSICKRNFKLFWRLMIKISANDHKNLLFSLVPEWFWFWFLALLSEINSTKTNFPDTLEKMHFAAGINSVVFVTHY